MAIDFHYSVDLCELIGNPNEKYRRIRKDTDTSKNVRAALAVLGKVLLCLHSHSIGRFQTLFQKKIKFWKFDKMFGASYFSTLFRNKV